MQDGGGGPPLSNCVLVLSPGTGKGGHREVLKWEGGGPSPRPASSHQAGAVAGDRSPARPGGSCQRRLPCTSCTRQRPLRQCHTAARVTTWPTTTSEGNRLPEGSMALGLQAAGRAGEAALRNRLPATGGFLPSRPGRRVWRGGAPGPGTAQPARPPCRTGCLAPRGLVLAPAPTVLLPASSPSSLSATRPLGHSELPTHLPLHPVQLSLRRASTLKVSWSLNPCLPAATPAGRRGLSDAQPAPPSTAWAWAPPASPGGDCGVLVPHSASKKPSGDSCQAPGGWGGDASAPAPTGPSGL